MELFVYHYRVTCFQVCSNVCFNYNKYRINKIFDNEMHNYAIHKHKFLSNLYSETLRIN